MIDPTLLREFYTPGAPLPAAAWEGLHPDPEAEIEALVLERRFPRRRPWHAYVPFESRWVPSRLRAALLRRRVRWGLAEREAFPRWPAEPVVEELRARVWAAARKAGLARNPAPFWPDGKRWAVALSHDLDSPEIYRRGWWKPFAELEERLGLRSSWHFCLNHLPEAAPVLDELARRGHEIAWHGFRHDYRIAYLREDRLRERIAAHVATFARWQIQGFRSPFYLRTAALSRGLSPALRYDSSARDTGTEFLSPHRREGCCTVFPFFREGLVELPLTIPEDLALTCLAGDDAGAITAAQRDKAARVREAGGVALVLTHPLRWISLRPGAFAAYRAFAESVARDPGAWRALPRDVAAWWRTRHGR
ncbi:MAG: hypothetical protein AAB368_06710 [bacterium]